MVRSASANAAPSLKHHKTKFDCDHEDGALPLPLAGEGWGGGVSAERLPKRREPPPDALRRPPPQAGEVEGTCGQTDLTKNHHALVVPHPAGGRGVKRPYHGVGDPGRQLAPVEPTLAQGF